MTGVISILNQQLAEAQAQGDLPRQVALAVALLKERVSDNGRIQNLIDQTCAQLVAQNDPSDLNAALGWYQTWHRHTRSPNAKAGMEAVQERIARLQDVERVLRDATTARDAVALRTVLSNLTANPDRLTTTTALITQGQALYEELQNTARRSWSERISRTNQMRARLQAAIPGALDHAMVAWHELIELDPTMADDPELADLPERANQARNRQRLLEAALNAPALGPLEEAYAGMMASTDRFSDSSLRLDRALVAQSERRGRLEQLHGELAGVDRSRLDVLVPLIEELAAIDPTGPAAATLEADRRRMTALATWQQTIVAGSDSDLAELEAAIKHLEASNERLADTAELIVRGRTLVRERRAAQAEHERKVRTAVGAIAVVVITLIGVTMRDYLGFGAIAAATDATTALAVAERYQTGWHVFHHAAAQKEVERLQDEVMVQRLAALAAMPDPAERLREIDAQLAHPVPVRQAELVTLQGRTRLELDDRAFAAANAVSDLSERIVALTTYATTVTDPTRAQAARDTIVVVERQRDAALWLTVTTAKLPEPRLAAIASYLALPTPSHVVEAGRLRDEAHAEQRRAAERAADDAEWAALVAIDDPVSGSTALETYLSKPAVGHIPAARERLTQLQIRRDAAAWAVANTGGDDAQRLAHLRAYVAGPTPRAHHDEATSAIATVVWTATIAPTDPAERLASVRNYLAEPTNMAHRTEALAMVADLPHVIDDAAWERARAVEVPAARIAALQAYLAVAGDQDHQQAAVEDIARTARSLIDSDPALVVSLPRMTLDRIPVSDLVRLAAQFFDRLPATLRARLPAPTPWSSAAGVDDYGRWLVLSIGPHHMRMRYLIEGQAQIMTPDGVVVVSNEAPCWMAENECTQALWSEILSGIFSDGNPSKHRGPDLPVHRVGRDDCQRFITACNARLVKDGIPAQVLLPTGAQWRFAAFTGTEGLVAIERGTTRSYDTRDLVRLAYAQENGHAPAAVGSGRRDHWGFTDLLGNVSEWCADDLDGSPHWRGGSWRDPRADCRPERAQKAKADEELEWVGLRLMVVGTTAVQKPR